MIQAVIEAAEAERAPVILQFNPANIRHIGLDTAAALGVHLAHRATIPVAVHIDHGLDFAQMAAAVRAGFTSLMYDGTPFPLAENIAVTAAVVRMAHAVGVSVEGEIGQMGGVEEGVFTAAGLGTMSDTDEAVEYARVTGVDALAVAVGNLHGTQVDRLDLDRLAAIRSAVGLPLVIHGGSGLPDAVVRAAIALGVRKFNVATQLNVAFLQGFQHAVAGRPGESNPRPALAAARAAVAGAVAAKLRLFGASGRAGGRAPGV
jgi:fructose-bisphosphate aldolase class II